MATLTLNNPAISFAAKNGSVDERAGIIYGMSCITQGEARGHDMHVDSKSIQTCFDATRSWASGVICKADHGSGLFEIIGTLRNFRIDGDRLRADLHLLKSHPRFASIIEMAKTAPSSVGLSISFSYTPETLEKKTYIRVDQLFSIDLVSNPACNPTGMFSAPTPQKHYDRITAAVFAAFGQDTVRSLTQGRAFEKAIENLERYLHFSNIEVPGCSFAHIEKRFGAAKPLWGMRRVEAASQQAKVNAALTRLA